MAIVLLAACLRLSRLDLVEFKLDEAKHCKLALDLLQGHLPMVGSISSLGMAKPPLMTYLMAIPLSISKDPVLATGFVALLNVGAVIGCYLLAKRYFGERVGLISSLLFAVSPWAVIYSRKIFTADLLPPFTVLFFWALFAAIVRRRYRWLVLAFFWLACLIQINPVAISYFPLLIALLFIYRSRIKPMPLLGGLLAFAMMFVPYIYYDVTHGMASLKTVLEVSGAPAELDFDSVKYAVQLIAGYGYHSLAGKSFERFLSQRADLAWLDALETALFFGGLVYLIWQVIRGWRLKREIAAYLILLLWFLTPVLVTARHSIPLYPHYFTMLYPVQFITIALFVERALEWSASLPSHLPLPRLATALLWASILAIALWQIYLSCFLLHFVDRNDTTGGYGVPLRYHLEVVENAKRLSDLIGNRQVMVLAEGDSPSWAEFPAIFDLLARPELAPKYIDSRRVLVFPQSFDDELSQSPPQNYKGRLCDSSSVQDVLYIVAPGSHRAAPFLSRYADEFADERVVLPGQQAAFRFYRFRAGSLSSLKASLVREGMPVALGNGVEILGYDVDKRVEPGDTLHLALYWTVKAKPDPSLDYRFFNHLIDEREQKWGQKDGMGYPICRWGEGDVIVSWYDMAVSPDAPPGRYWVITGMYTYPDLVRVPVLEGAQAVGDSVRLGPISVGP